VRVWKVRAPRGACTFHTLTSARRRRAEVSHSLTLYRYIQTSNANPRANMHTSMDRAPALRGKFCTFVFHICDIVIDMLCADHQATVSCICILPLVKIIPGVCYMSMNDRIISCIYEQRMNFTLEKMTSYSFSNVTSRSIV